jgi:anti-anti-sigma regulatory factor
MGSQKEGDVLVNIGKDGVGRIKLIGEIRYDSSAKGFVEFVNTKLIDESVAEVIIDAHACDYIDSANIGILAQIAMMQENKGAKKTKIFYSEDSKVYGDVENMNINSLFDVVFCGGGKCAYDWCDSGDYEKLPKHELSQTELAEIMFDTHETLYNMGEKNKAKFESVMEYLKKSRRQK